MNTRERLVHWVVDHATWHLAVRLLVSVLSSIAVTRIPYVKNLDLVEVVPLALLAFALVFLLIDRILSYKKVEEIRFDYLPDSPLNHGWKIAYGQQVAYARWTSPKGAPVPGCISMEMEAGCAIELNIAPNATVSDTMVFSAKYENSTMLFVMVGLTSVDGSRHERKWIKFVIGRQAARPTIGYEGNEWTLPILGKALENGWRRFEISFPDAVRQTWGTLGLTLSSVNVIRIRGSVSISPIELYESPERKWFGTKTAHSPVNAA